MEGQITIWEYNQMKEEIRRKLQDSSENFVAIGYRLKQIRDNESYREDGYEDIYDLANKEYGLSKSVTSRFMAINTKFSIDGNSESLNPEYASIGSSKLAEMLTLTDSECQLISERTTVKEIRELKRFSQEEEQEEENKTYTPLQKCIIDYFSDQKRADNLNEIIRLLKEETYSEENDRKAYYEVNPSGYTTHKKGIIFLFLYDYETGIKYKSLTEKEPISMSVGEFLSELLEIYGNYFNPEETYHNTWTAFYGIVIEKEPEKETKKEPPKTAEHSVKSSNSVATSQQKLEEKEDESETEELEEIEEPETEESEEDESEDTDEQDVIEESEEEGLLEGVEETPYKKLQKQAAELAETIHQFLQNESQVEQLDIQKRNAEQLAAVLEQMIEIKREED